MTQSFNIPDSISSDALQAHLDNLVDQDSANEFPDDLFELAEHWVKQSTEHTDNPMIVHKIMMTMIIHRMIQFHENVAERACDSHDGPASAWLKDAGKFQAIINILHTIECGPDDPLCACSH